MASRRLDCLLLAVGLERGGREWVIEGGEVRERGEREVRER